MLKVAFSPLYEHPLPPGHRFPMVKYGLIPEQLLYEGTLSPSQLHQPIEAQPCDIIPTHTEAYWAKLSSLSLTKAEERRTGFPLSAQLVQREITIAQGTIDLSLHALAYGCGLNVAGGTHHAFADHGEGFCLLNDQAMAANHLLNHGLAKKILIVDLDVHQGNGTAAIFQREHSVFTFSMHGEKNYPGHKETSDLDIPLPNGTEDGEYLRILQQTLPEILQQVKPDFCYYLSGVDVLATDQLGKLALTPQGCAARDRFVLQALQAAGLPVVVCMGGGYSKRLADIVNAHCETFRIAQQIYG